MTSLGIDSQAYWQVTFFDWNSLPLPACESIRRLLVSNLPRQVERALRNPLSADLGFLNSLGIDSQAEIDYNYNPAFSSKPGSFEVLYAHVHYKNRGFSDGFTVKYFGWVVSSRKKPNFEGEDAKIRFHLWTGFNMLLPRTKAGFFLRYQTKKPISCNGNEHVAQTMVGPCVIKNPGFEEKAGVNALF